MVPTKRLAVTVFLALAGAAPAAKAAAPPFAATIHRVTASDLRWSYRPGCPVGPSQLRLLRLGYWGFDKRAHTGELVVNVDVARHVVSVFERLYNARFPIRRMRTIEVYKGSDSASTADDNTSGFNCRYAVASGPPRWSQHAYGHAIDVNTVENPYVFGGRARPAAGARYVDRSRYRPGMAVPGGVLVRAFESIGWGWGGRWSSPDYQHFSTNGR
jgi:hypothetical protein